MVNCTICDDDDLHCNYCDKEQIEPSHDDNTDKEMALSFLQAIDEAECSLQAWDLICNAIEALK